MICDSIGKYKSVDAARKLPSYAGRLSLIKALDEVGTVMASSECFEESHTAKKIRRHCTVGVVEEFS